MQQKACFLVSEMPQPGLLLKNEQLLKLYRTGRPYHDFRQAQTPSAIAALALQAQGSTTTR
jgi:hypothetical protein